jgi:hypothetical protein
MAEQSKVPADPNLSQEMRKFLDDRSRAEGKLRQEFEAAIAALPSFASEAEAEAGTLDDKMMSPATTAAAIAALNPFGNAFIHAQEQQAGGTQGGTFTNGAWRVRTLNTVLVNHITGASLASDKITLPAGRYFVHANAPAYNINQHQARLFDNTGNVALLYGPGEYCFNTQSRAFVSGEFTLAVQSDVRLEHRSNATGGTASFGNAVSWSTEVFSEVIIWKLA